MASFDEKVICRMGELVFRASAWHRRLWGIGIVGAILELVDAGELVVQTGHGSYGFTILCKQVGEMVKRDPALLSSSIRAPLLHEIYKPTAPDLQRLANLRQFSVEMEACYLEMLAEVEPDERFGVELWARSIAAHLLDAGWSEDGVRQLSDRHTNLDPVLLQSLLDDASKRQEQDFEVVVAGARVPKELQAGGNWVPRDQQPDGLPQVDLDGLSGYFTTTVAAWDQNAAGALFGSEIARAVSRYQASRRGRQEIALGLTAYVRVLGRETWKQVDLSPAARRVEIKELLRSDPSACFTPRWSDPVDNAIILAETTEASTGPQVPALLWASLESIFEDSDDPEFHLSQRLSWLLLASLVRAELTLLAHHLVNEKGPIAERLTDKTNSEMCEILEHTIRDAEAISFIDTRDELALERLSGLFGDPEAVDRMRSYLAGSIARVHRERNRAMHGGTLSVSGGLAAQRSGPPLIAAILDRVVWAEKQTPPVPLDELIARAMIRGRLALIDRSGSQASLILNPGEGS